jgi:hypothetical protein
MGWLGIVILAGLTFIGIAFVGLTLWGAILFFDEAAGEEVGSDDE